MAPRVLFYISGHGLGHASRCAEVMRELGRLRPEVGIEVATRVPAWFLQDGALAAPEVRDLECDTGVVQPDSLRQDLPATLEAARAHLGRWPAMVEAEVARLAADPPALVVADVPPVAFEIAEALGVPSLGLANFGWDWVYRHWAGSMAGFAPVADRIAQAHGLCDLLLRLPLSLAEGEDGTPESLASFPRALDIPLVARRSRWSRAEARRAAGIPDDGHPVALLSFGGIGLGEGALRGLDGNGSVVWLAGERVAPHPSVRNLDRGRLRELGLGYPDLVRAADVVVTKPGYGIVAECAANGTRMVYTDRGHFAEYPVARAFVERHLAGRHLPSEALRRGEVAGAVLACLEVPWAGAPLDCSGARVAALEIARRLDGERGS